MPDEEGRAGFTPVIPSHHGCFGGSEAAKNNGTSPFTIFSIAR
jgi:hypothetical protein